MKQSFLLLALLVLMPVVLYAQSSNEDLRPDSSMLSRKATLPLPGKGVFYVRMGKPGGVQINSTRRTRSGYFPPDSTSRPVDRDTAQDFTPTALVKAPQLGHFEATVTPTPQLPSSEAVSWADVRDMERYLLEQLNIRINEAITANQEAIDDTEAYLGERLDDRFDNLQGQIEELNDNLGRIPANQQAPLVITPPAAAAQVIESATPATVDRFIDSVQTRQFSMPIVERIEHAMLETGVFLALTVNFEFGQDALLPSSLPTLNAVGEVLGKYPDLRIEIAGHTDNTGPEQVNIRLSQERADTVRDYLLDTFGAIETERIEANGYGPSRPIASNERRTGRMLNRRVEFVVLNPEASEKYTRKALPTEQSEDELRQMLRQLLEEELQSMSPTKQDSVQVEIQ